jgi:hypothetical protein
MTHTATAASHREGVFATTFIQYIQVADPQLGVVSQPGHQLSPQSPQVPGPGGDQGKLAGSLLTGLQSHSITE